MKRCWFFMNFAVIWLLQTAHFAALGQERWDQLQPGASFLQQGEPYCPPFTTLPDYCPPGYGQGINQFAPVVPGPSQAPNLALQPSNQLNAPGQTQNPSILPPSAQPTISLPTEDYSQLASVSNGNNSGLFRDISAGGESLNGPTPTFGDFLAPAGTTLFVQPPPGASVRITGAFRNPDETLADFVFFQNHNGRLVADGNNLSANGINLPDTQFTSIASASQISGANNFAINNGDPAFQAAFVSALLTSYAHNSTIVLRGGQATISDDSGIYHVFQSYDLLSSSHSPIGLSVAGSPSLLTGVQKIAENNSPIPRDRVFFDYSFFKGAALTAVGSDVHRYAPGFEKTCFGGFSSLEVRLPMAATINSTQIADGVSGLDLSNFEFGNLMLSLKSVVYTDGVEYLTAGVGVSLPTADDVAVNLLDGTQLLRVKNQSVRLLPYLAALGQSGDWYAQYYAQLDLTLGGHDVLANLGNGLQQIGELKDQHYLYLSASLSKWMYRDFVRELGLSLTSEIHYSKTLDDADAVSQGNYLLGQAGYNADVVNATFGTTGVIGSTTGSLGVGVPLTADRGFDMEIRAFINRYF